MVRAMNRHAVAAMMWGVAVGALAYRYGVLPFEWASPWKHVLPGIAAGLVVGGKQLVSMGEHEDVKRPAVPLLLALGVVGGLVAFGISYLAFPTLARAGISKRELPGFSIALPSGERFEEGRDYNLGKLVLKNAASSRAVVFVQWELGAMLEKDDLQPVADILSKAAG